MKFHPHEVLFNLVIKMTYITSHLGSPTGENGILKKKYNYEFQLETFRDKFYKIYKTSFHPPDGFIRNKQKKISITVECKSGHNKESNSLLNQITFYSENKDFKDIFISEDEKNEILIVCFEHCIQDIIDDLRNIDVTRNIIIWSVNRIGDNYFIQKKHGTHIDEELDKLMSSGLEIPPLTNLLFVSHNIPRASLIAEVGIRLSIKSFLYLESLQVEEFIEEQKDYLRPSRKRIKQAIRHFLTLVREVGYQSKDKQTIYFKKIRNGEIIQKKIDFISTLNTRELDLFLKKGFLTTKDMAELPKIRQFFAQHKSLDDYFKENPQEGK